MKGKSKPTVSRYFRSFCNTVALLAVVPALLAAQQNLKFNDVGPRPVSSVSRNDERLVVNTDVVSLNVSVTDELGRSISGLSRENFKLFDNKSEQEILYFEDTDAPASIGIVFDLTGSMSGSKMARAVSVLQHFFEVSNPDDEYSVIGAMNGSARLIVDRSGDSESIVSRISTARSGGETALYDACYLGIRTLDRGTRPKRALVIISDGEDNHSRFRFRDLYRLMQESGVLVYSVGILEDHGTDYDFGRAALEEISSASGGKAFFPQSDSELWSALESIAVELRRQYSIGYRPLSLALDGKWHKLKVKLDHKNIEAPLNVRSRAGYRAVAIASN